MLRYRISIGPFTSWRDSFASALHVCSGRNTIGYIHGCDRATHTQRHCQFLFTHTQTVQQSFWRAFGGNFLRVRSYDIDTSSFRAVRHVDKYLAKTTGCGKATLVTCFCVEMVFFRGLPAAVCRLSSVIDAIIAIKSSCSHEVCRLRSSAVCSGRTLLGSKRSLVVSGRRHWPLAVFG